VRRRLLPPLHGRPWIVVAAAAAVIIVIIVLRPPVRVVEVVAIVRALRIVGRLLNLISTGSLLSVLARSVCLFRRDGLLLLFQLLMRLALFVNPKTRPLRKTGWRVRCTGR
jgi:hypothetical protein